MGILRIKWGSQIIGAFSPLLSKTFGIKYSSDYQHIKESMFTCIEGQRPGRRAEGNGLSVWARGQEKGCAFLEVCPAWEQREKHQQQEEDNEEEEERLSWVEEKCDLEACNLPLTPNQSMQWATFAGPSASECRPVAWTTKPINSGFLHCHSHDSLTRVNFYIFDVLFSFYLPEWKSLHWSAWGNVVPRRKIRT